MSVQAHVVVAYEAFRVDVELAVDDGEVLALLGPNGAGKTTSLRAVAGLEPLHAGYVRLDDMLVEDPDQGVRLPAAQRRVGVVFGGGALFPHLSARDNTAFGLRARGMPRSEARAAAAQWLARVGVPELAARRPGQLSAGQAQRVALARALAAEPRVLLLDEPLSRLDAQVTAVLRSELRSHLRRFGGATVLVSHDPLDALMLGDRIAVLESGTVVQVGSPAEVAARPRSEFVAQMVGLNLLRGPCAGGTVAAAPGLNVTTTSRLRGEVFAVFRPSSVAVHARSPEGSPRNAWPATIADMVPHGDAVRLRLDAGVVLLADVTPAAAAGLQLGPGQRVWAAVKATDVAVYPA